MADMTETEQAIVKAIGEVFDEFFGANSATQTGADEQIGIDEKTVLDWAQSKAGASESDVKAVINKLVVEHGFTRKDGLLIFSDGEMWVG